MELQRCRIPFSRIDLTADLSYIERRGCCSGTIKVKVSVRTSKTIDSKVGLGMPGLNI